MNPHTKLKILAVTQTLEESAFQKGFLSGKLKRLKFGSRQYKALEKEYHIAASQVAETKQEIFESLYCQAIAEGPSGPVGMPGLRGQNADGSPGETEDEYWQRGHEARAHNERFFATHLAARAIHEK